MDRLSTHAEGHASGAAATGIPAGAAGAAAQLAATPQHGCLPQLKGASQGWLPRALPQALQELRLSELASVQCTHCQMFASASRSSWLAALLAAAHHQTQFSGQFLE